MTWALSLPHPPEHLADVKAKELDPIAIHRGMPLLAFVAPGRPISTEIVPRRVSCPPNGEYQLV